MKILYKVLFLLLTIPISQNLIAEESFLGVTINRSSMNDVLELIRTSGGTITENAPLDRFGLTRVIRFKGGALPGAPFYTSGDFLFDKNGTLYRFTLAGSLSDANATQAYGAHVKTVIASNKLLSQTNDTVKVALSNITLTFTLNRSQNTFMEDWQAGSSNREAAPPQPTDAEKSWPVYREYGLCWNNCQWNACNGYFKTGDDLLDKAACDQRVSACQQQCAEIRDEALTDIQ